MKISFDIVGQAINLVKIPQLKFIYNFQTRILCNCIINTIPKFEFLVKTLYNFRLIYMQTKCLFKP